MNDIEQYLENIEDSDKKIDFIAERREDKEYIQVCYLLASEEVRQREYAVLHEIQDSFPKFVLSLDP